MSGRIAQRLENTRRIAAHVVGDGQDETGRQLAERRARPGKRGRIGEKLLAGQQHVELAGALQDIAVPGFLHPGHVVGDTPEHLLHAFGGLAIVATSHVTADEHLPGVVGQVNWRQIRRNGWGGQRARFLGNDLCCHVVLLYNKNSKEQEILESGGKPPEQQASFWTPKIQG